jgi:hypothetical protein
VTRQIRDQERGGKATITVIDEGTKDDDKDFWLKFGCPRPSASRIRAAEQGGRDRDIHTRTGTPGKLSCVSIDADNVIITPVAAVVLKKSLFVSSSTFILDSGVVGLSLYVWVGKGAGTGERLHSMKMATDYLTNRG